MSRARADLVLVARGFYASRAKAQEAIAQGFVRVDGTVLSKASAMIEAESAIEAQAPYPWVSRGGVKLAAALDHFGFDPQDRLCLDVGASTGGFTDVLIARGARQVVAVDVGRAQLHAKLAADPRVISRESKDARDLTPADLPAAPQIVTCDLSFIPLALVLPKLLELAAPGACLVALIKPQFEVGPKLVVKGIVKDDAARQKVCADIEALVTKARWTLKGRIASPIEGADGNREFLLGAVKANS